MTGPHFVDNREGNTFARSITEHLETLRKLEESPELVRAAPTTAPLRRLDEATAARKPVLRWRQDDPA